MAYPLTGLARELAFGRDTGRSVLIGEGPC